MQTFTNRSNKPIGYEDQGIFYKKVQGSKHLMRIYNGWGIDESVLKKIKDCRIRILDTETNIVYVTDYKTFNEMGIRKDFDGKQVFLPKKYFVVEYNKQKTLI